ncbi:MAG TPA: BolA family transcriptional regulator [Deltaproteobacteria bacterium]|nr:BolA family transcriptional regulator [Deltaproteobacteria bacterium]HCP47289.1 BolA family transcriptional regulator [Deltaproteobacteria bacterium]
MSNSPVGGGPVQQSITSKLADAFAPVALEVINESFMHSVPPGSESHFKVVVVSQQFADESLVKRHRMVHTALRSELDAGLHALSVEALTPEQWQARGGATLESPQCRGGSKSD